MANASTFLTLDQKATVEAAIAEAEKKTSAEIMVVVAPSSGRYDRGEDIAGLWLGAIVLLVLWTLFPVTIDANSFDEPWIPYEYFIWLGGLVGGFIVGAILASKVGKLRMLFTPTSEKQEEVESRARQVFFDQRIHHTKGGTGVLIYISLDERLVSILADETCLPHLPDHALEKHRDTLSTSLGKEPDKGLALVISTIGEELKDELPYQADDVDEIANEVVFLDG